MRCGSVRSRRALRNRDERSERLDEHKAGSAQVSTRFVHFSVPKRPVLCHSSTVYWDSPDNPCKSRFVGTAHHSTISTRNRRGRYWGLQAPSTTQHSKNQGPIKQLHTHTRTAYTQHLGDPIIPPTNHTHAEHILFSGSHYPFTQYPMPLPPTARARRRRAGKSASWCGLFVATRLTSPSHRCALRAPSRARWRRADTHRTPVHCHPIPSVSHEAGC